VYVNGKMRSVDTILGMGVKGIMENDRGVNSTMIYGKNFCKCHNILPVQQQQQQQKPQKNKRKNKV
jgi:hypothetical protein